MEGFDPVAWLDRWCDDNHTHGMVLTDTGVRALAAEVERRTFARARRFAGILRPYCATTETS